MTKQSKSILGLFLVMALFTTMMPVTSVTAASSWQQTYSDSLKSSVNIGDYVQMGTYYDEPILWRCADVDENGKLMVSNQILCYKSYCGCGWDISKKHGDNIWSNSSLRCWLNSSANSGEVAYLCEVLPTVPNVFSKSYSQEAGFLSGFSDAEQQLIKSVYTDSDIDKVFLLSEIQYNNMRNNRDILGDDFILSAPTEKARNELFNSDARMYADLWMYTQDEANNLLLSDPYILYDTLETSSLEGVYWLRDNVTSPYTNSNLQTILYIASDGNIYMSGAYSNGNFGVRPAFYMSDDINFDLGNGTAENPYAINNDTEPLSGLPDTIELEYGGISAKTITLNQANVTFEIDDINIAEVDDFWSDDVTKTGDNTWVVNSVSDVVISANGPGETVLTATSPGGEVLKCKINVTAGISIVINGNKITPQYDPIIVNDTTLVHIRTFENIGATVDWNQETQTATVKKGNRTVSATIGGWELNIEHNNGTGKMPVGLVPIQSVGQGYTMVPLRAITEAMGGVVNWIEDTRTVDIYYSDMIDYILNSIDTDTDIFDINTLDTRKIFSYYEYCYDYMDKYYEDDFWQAFSIAFDDPTMPIKTLIESMYDPVLWDYKESKNIDLSEVYTKNNVAECLAEAIDSLTDEDIDLYSVNNEVKTVISKISSVTGLVLEEDSDLEGLKIFSKVLKGMSDSIKVINTTSDVLESALADYAVSETYLEAFENALNDTELKNDVLDDTVAQLKIEYNAWYADKLSELVSKIVSGKVTGGIAKAIGKGSYNFVNFVREYFNIVSNNDDRAKLLKKINAYMIYSLPLSRCYKYYADKIYDGDYLTYDVLQCEKLFDLSKATRIQEYKNVLSLDKIDRTYDKSKPIRYNEDLGKSEEELLDIGITLLENTKYLK